MLKYFVQESLKKEKQKDIIRGKLNKEFEKNSGCMFY